MSCFFAGWPDVLLGRDLPLFRSIAHNSHGAWDDKGLGIKKIKQFLKLYMCLELNNMR
jgi:hypothetical protein